VHVGRFGISAMFAIAVVWPVASVPSAPSDPVEPRVDGGPQLVERAYTNSTPSGPGRRWVRAVRDLAVERFDVDALEPYTPVTVWTVSNSEGGSELVAFRVDRTDDEGGPFAAARVLLDGTATWVEERGGTLEGPLSSRPVGYRAISSNIGLREHPLRHRVKFHAGTDFAAPIGTPVTAIADGKVLRIGRNWTAGKFLVVKHDTGHETRYLHLHGMLKGLEPGQRVRKGDVLGVVGKTGRVTGPHLHYELRDRRGYPLDAARVRWPAAGALTDAAALRELSFRLAVLETGSQPVVAPRGLERHVPPPVFTRVHLAPALPVRGEPEAASERARSTPPPPKRRRRVMPAKRSVFDVESDGPAGCDALDDPLARRAMQLAEEFS
jgi:murein DD-endopeptidase MepM/ murein hydrolase activator NlpD